MKWFRSNVKRLSHIALFALAIQFALSFGHFHGVAAEAAPAAVGLFKLSPVGTPPSSTAVSRSSGQPASDHGTGEHPDDICAICAVMAMANAVLFAMPPVLLLPEAIAFSYFSTDGRAVRVSAVRGAFQPRGPPLSRS